MVLSLWQKSTQKQQEEKSFVHMSIFTIVNK
jgi:hypothetical protein